MNTPNEGEGMKIPPPGRIILAHCRILLSRFKISCHRNKMRKMLSITKHYVTLLIWVQYIYFLVLHVLIAMNTPFLYIEIIWSLSIEWSIANCTIIYNNITNGRRQMYNHVQVVPRNMTVGESLNSLEWLFPLFVQLFDTKDQEKYYMGVMLNKNWFQSKI